jgi:hypothetical protein
MFCDLIWFLSKELCVFYPRALEHGRFFSSHTCIYSPYLFFFTLFFGQRGVGIHNVITGARLQLLNNKLYKFNSPTNHINQIHRQNTLISPFLKKVHSLYIEQTFFLYFFLKRRNKRILAVDFIYMICWWIKFIQFIVPELILIPKANIWQPSPCECDNKNYHMDVIRSITKLSENRKTSISHNLGKVLKFECLHRTFFEFVDRNGLQNRWANRYNTRRPLHQKAIYCCSTYHLKRSHPKCTSTNSKNFGVNFSINESVITLLLVYLLVVNYVK